MGNLNQKQSDYLDELFRKVANEIAEVLVRKNHDYGDSFHQIYEKFGDVSTYMRVSDKIGRLANMVRHTEMRVDEPIDDVYRDIAGYCILTLVSRIRLNEEKYSGIDFDENNDSIHCGSCCRPSIPTKEGVHKCAVCGEEQSVVIVRTSSGTEYRSTSVGKVVTTFAD